MYYTACFTDSQFYELLGPFSSADSAHDAGQEFVDDDENNTAQTVYVISYVLPSDGWPRKQRTLGNIRADKHMIERFRHEA